MPVTIAITDNGDDTGATATIAGSSGAANVVTVYRLDGGGTGTMTAGVAYTRTGDGTLSLPVAAGTWFAYFTSAGVTVGLYTFGASSGLLSVATRCRRAVIDTIKMLSIPPAQRVYEQMYPDENNIAFPCVLVTVEGVQESAEQGLSTRDDIGHPVKVEIADRNSHHNHGKLPDYEFWREKVYRCFLNQQLIGVPESVICRVEPNVVIDPNLPQFEYVVTGLVIRCVCREPRGVGV